MTIQQFFYWLKGFSEAVNPYNVTPKQWETILEKLDQVSITDDDGKKMYTYKYDMPKLDSVTSKQLLD